jgi:hypothetical protein
MSPTYESQLAALRRHHEQTAAAAHAAASQPGLSGVSPLDLWGPAVLEPEASAAVREAVRLAPGTRARCLAPGKYYGVVGEIVKRGRSRYHLRVPVGVLTVPFALVEAA